MPMPGDMQLQRDPMAERHFELEAQRARLSERAAHFHEKAAAFDAATQANIDAMGIFPLPIRINLARIAAGVYDYRRMAATAKLNMMDR